MRKRANRFFPFMVCSNFRRLGLGGRSIREEMEQNRNGQTAKGKKTEEHATEIKLGAGNDDQDQDEDVESPWMSMPDYIAEAVLNSLPLSDFIRFAAVCKHWLQLQQEHSSRTHPLPPRILALPWLILPLRHKQNPEEKEALLCLSIFEGKSFSIRSKTLLQSLSFCTGPFGTSSGWLVLYLDDHSVCLVNPVSRDMVNLPRTPRSLDIVYGASSVPVLSPPPKQVLFLVFRSKKMVLVHRKGDSKWTELHHNQDSLCQDMMCSLATTGMGEFYCLSNSLDLFVVFSYPVPGFRMVCMDKKNLPLDDELPDKRLMRILVQANNDVLLLVEIMPQHNAMKTEGFLVFKAELEKNEWVKVKTLGDQVLFLQTMNHASFRASHGVKGNCIYYSRYGRGSWYVFDLDSGVMTTTTVADRFPCSRMIMPSLC